jgi:threonine dehydratase
VEEAMRALFSDTHNVVEGAGAASLAGLLQERDKLRGQTAAIVLTGANVDPLPFARVLGHEIS